MCTVQELERYFMTLDELRSSLQEIDALIADIPWEFELVLPARLQALLHTRARVIENIRMKERQQ